MKFLLRIVSVILLVFVLPTLVSAGLWATRDHPDGWSSAKWGSSGLLPSAEESPEAAIYIFSAMTGGLKGAIASHAWIVTKDGSTFQTGTGSTFSYTPTVAGAYVVTLTVADEVTVRFRFVIPSNK